MTVTASSFRQNFPAFSDTTKYPDTLVDFWIGINTNLINSDRWKDMTDFGIQLITAHELVLEAQGAKAAAIGGFPGTNTGTVNNRSADKLTVGYDSTVAAQKDAGHWNLTSYGTRYYRFAMMFGAGPIQVNTPGCDPTPGMSGGAWPGPMVGPW